MTSNRSQLITAQEAACELVSNDDATRAGRTSLTPCEKRVFEWGHHWMRKMPPSNFNLSKRDQCVVTLLRRGQCCAISHPSRASTAHIRMLVSSLNRSALMQLVARPAALTRGVIAPCAPTSRDARNARSCSVVRVWTARLSPEATISTAGLPFLRTAHVHSSAHFAHETRKSVVGFAKIELLHINC